MKNEYIYNVGIIFDVFLFRYIPRVCINHQWGIQPYVMNWTWITSFRINIFPNNLMAKFIACFHETPLTWILEENFFMNKDHETYMNLKIFTLKIHAPWLELETFHFVPQYSVYLIIKKWQRVSRRICL